MYRKVMRARITTWPSFLLDNQRKDYNSAEVMYRKAIELDPTCVLAPFSVHLSAQSLTLLAGAAGEAVDRRLP